MRRLVAAVATATAVVAVAMTLAAIADTAGRRGGALGLLETKLGVDLSEWKATIKDAAVAFVTAMGKAA